MQTLDFNPITFFLSSSLPLDRYPRADQHKRRDFVEAVENRLGALPGVKSAAATTFLPSTGFWGTTNFLLRGQGPAEKK